MCVCVCEDGFPLLQSLFDHIPVGVGSKGIIPMGARDLEEALEMGMDWSLREGYAWAEDKVIQFWGEKRTKGGVRKPKDEVSRSAVSVILFLDHC